MSTTDKVTLAFYLWTRLRQLGIESLHGVPGDYNLVALDSVAQAGLNWVGDANELNAGYAADGYARVKGMGALVTTFGVGELSAINATAGSFAEYVPVVQIVGSPSTSAQRDRMLLHHTLGDGNFGVFADMYKRVTVAQAFLRDAKMAPAQIDDTLRQCWVRSRPVYIDLPSDVAKMEVDAALLETPIDKAYPKNAPEAEAAATQAILEKLYSAKQPCVLVDACVLRRKLVSDVDALLRKTGLPAFVSPMGKSAIDESLPNFCGVYAGDGSYDAVRDYVAASDLVLTIGSIKSDANTGGFTYRLSILNTIDLHTGTVSIGYSHFDLQMRGVIQSLTSLIDVERLSIKSFEASPVRAIAQKLTQSFREDTITQAWLWKQVSEWLRPGDIVLTETGTAQIGMMDTIFPKETVAITQILWGSIGYTLPAAQGAALAARELGKKQRVILFEGDGSFQLTAQAIGTMLRQNLDIVIFVINNDGYTIERWIHGMEEKYNDVPMWKYADIPQAMGGNASNCASYKINTKHSLQALWDEGTFDNPKGLNLVEMFVPKEDAPVALKMLAAASEKMNRQS